MKNKKGKKGLIIGAVVALLAIAVGVFAFTPAGENFTGNLFKFRGAERTKTDRSTSPVARERIVRRSADSTLQKESVDTRYMQPEDTLVREGEKTVTGDQQPTSLLPVEFQDLTLDPNLVDESGSDDFDPATETQQVNPDEIGTAVVNPLTSGTNIKLGDYAVLLVGEVMGQDINMLAIPADCRFQYTTEFISNNMCYVESLGLLNDLNTDPNRLIPRAEAAKLFMLAIDKKTPEPDAILSYGAGCPPVTDIYGNEWYATYVCNMVVMGIADTFENQFFWGEFLTHEQAQTWAANYNSL